MNSDNYSAPEITQVAEEKPAEPVLKVSKAVVTDIKEDVGKTSNERFWRDLVDDYIVYTNGERSFKTDKQRLTTTQAFMERTGAMLGYEYAEFEDCMLYLIQTLRNNTKSHENGRFTRFAYGIENQYPLYAINQFRIFITFVISIANAWPTRAKRAQSADIASLTKDMPAKAKENLAAFVRKMANFGFK